MKLMLCCRTSCQKPNLLYACLICISQACTVTSDVLLVSTPALNSRALCVCPCKQEVAVPEVLYEEVIEVDERVVLMQDGCQMARKDPKRIVTGVKHTYVPVLLLYYLYTFTYQWCQQYNQGNILYFLVVNVGM